MTCIACHEQPATSNKMCNNCNQAMWDGLDAIEKQPHWMTPDEIELLSAVNTTEVKSPIQKIGDEYYFWSKDWTTLHGPYNKYEYVAQACKDHAEGK